MSSRLFMIVLFTLLFIFSSCRMFFPTLVEASICVSAQSDIALAIANAEQTIVVCYQAVAEADEAGADVTALLALLNEAGWHLSEAKWAYEMGDFDSASYHALLSQEMLEGFVAEAEILKETALQQRYWDFVVNVVGSIVGTIIVICSSFVVWVLLKRRHEKV